MAPQFLIQLLTRRRSPASPKGFTFIELLVVLLIGGIIISGLMYLAVELLTADKRESVRSETQRDLQLALDYMSSELREAIYVYPDVIDPDTNQPFTFLPPTDAYGDPVIAFWKQQPLPREVRQACATTVIPECLRGHSYSLVVYSLKLADPNGNDGWQGKARIIRSAMTQFDVEDGTENVGYISPVAQQSVQFNAWPNGNTPTFSAPRELTDFVDDGAGASGQTRSGTCPTGYAVSPSQPIDGSVRSFFACISQPGTDDDGITLSPESWSQEIILYLQGNAAGRSGIYGDDGFLPTLETRVLSRGILNKNL